MKKISGKRALEFDGATVLDVGQKHHVIAIYLWEHSWRHMDKNIHSWVEQRHVGGTSMKMIFQRSKAFRRGNTKIKSVQEPYFLNLFF